LDGFDLDGDDVVQDFDTEGPEAFVNVLNHNEKQVAVQLLFNEIGQERAVDILVLKETVDKFIESLLDEFIMIVWAGHSPTDNHPRKKKKDFRLSIFFFLFASIHLTPL